MRNNSPYNFSKPRNWKPNTWEKKRDLAHMMRLELIKLLIKNGVKFDTEAERGCIALEQPDHNGDFTAIDSDGVKCRFCTRMVTRIYE